MAFRVFRELVKRRVPQILGLYLGGSWVVIEFVGMLVDRYSLSPHLVSLSLVVLGSLIPTVVLLAYFHGMPGPNEWATAEKVGIPLNLLGAVALVAFLYSDKPLGATTTTLVLENEAGETVERVVPKTEFRKKLIVYNFENETADSTLNWLRYGVSIGLLLDLDQDLYMRVVEPDVVLERLERAGYPEGLGAPLTLYASIANELHQDYFVVGDFSKQNDEFAVTTSLYETRRQRLLAENTFVGTDVLDLVDQTSVQLRQDLGISERHIEETSDLRIADILTDSPEAFRLQVAGYREILATGNWEAAKDYLERAVAADPTAAFAQYQLSVCYLVLNEREKADSAARQAMRHIYRVPERLQFYLKYHYYSAIELDAAKRFAVAKMSVELFPEDIDAHVQLAREYGRRGQTVDMIAEYQQILEIDPSQYDYLREIGYAYRWQGQYEQALEYFQRYAEAVPNDYSSFQAMGLVRAALGDYERARSDFERALILDPENVEVMNSLATVAFNQGRFDESLAQHEQALAAARTPQERASAYRSLSRHHETVGQLDKAIEYRELGWAEGERFVPPSVVLAQWALGGLGLYVQAGREDVAFEIIRRAENELVSPLDATIPSGYLEVYLELEDADRAEEALEQLEAQTEEMGEGALRDYLFAAHGKIHELRGEYEQAIESYQQALTLAPTDVTRHRALGRCYRLRGQRSRALEQFKANLKVTPYNPKTHYEIALLYADMGDRDQALNHLRTALEVWKDADTDFRPAQEARQRLVELEAAAATS
jgi:tetratricopeptide (TPR) repeat protein